MKRVGVNHYNITCLLLSIHVNMLTRLMQ